MIPVHYGSGTVVNYGSVLVSLRSVIKFHIRSKLLTFTTPVQDVLVVEFENPDAAAAVTAPPLLQESSFHSSVLD